MKMRFIIKEHYAMKSKGVPDYELPSEYRGFIKESVTVVTDKKVSANIVRPVRYQLDVPKEKVAEVQTWIDKRFPIVEDL